MLPLTLYSGKDPAYISIVIMVALCGIIFFRLMLRHLSQLSRGIPSNVFCFLLGLILGEAYVWNNDQLGVLGDSMHHFVTMRPETFLVVFVPPLIFQNAANIDFHVFYRSFYQTLLFATIGVAINILFVAVLATYVFPYDWSFTWSALFGTLMSSTDPVSLVATLKQLGMFLF
jgi:NhaP-type Na+/H+ or K+/H+ antiporter